MTELTTTELFPHSPIGGLLVLQCLLTGGSLPSFKRTVAIDNKGV